MRRISHETTELIPDAVVAIDVDHVVSVHGKPDEGCDGLGEWRGAVFEDEDGAQFAIKRYVGFPKGMASVYLGGDRACAQTVRDRVDRICVAFGIPAKDVCWKRGDPYDNGPARDMAGEPATPGGPAPG